IVVVEERLFCGVVVDVLHVDIRRQAEEAELPQLVQAHVELVKQRQSLTERFPLEGDVRSCVARIDARNAGGVRDGRREGPAHDSKASSELPTASQAV